MKSRKVLSALLGLATLISLSGCVVLSRPVAVGLRAPAVVVQPLPRCHRHRGVRHCHR